LAIEENLVLAAFIPVIVYMADAAAGQTQAVFIRAMATEKSLELKKYIGREISINILLSIFLSVLIFAISYLWINIFEVSLILGLSVFFTVFCAIIISLILPIIFRKMKFDPAIASGPFATVITDILSLMIYFTVATLVIN
jgi:magnesium transporter